MDCLLQLQKVGICYGLLTSRLLLLYGPTLLDPAQWGIFFCSPDIPILRLGVLQIERNISLVGLLDGGEKNATIVVRPLMY